MRDYKGALYYLMTETHEYNSGKIIPIAQNAIDDLQELVERNESMKVITSEQGVHFCPNCHGSVWQIKYESNFCFRCGQKLDWSK